MNTLVAAGFYLRDTPLDPNDVKPGWLALGLVAVLCVAVVVLVRSFVKHARRAREPWDEN